MFFSKFVILQKSRGNNKSNGKILMIKFQAKTMDLYRHSAKNFQEAHLSPE